MNTTIVEEEAYDMLYPKIESLYKRDPDTFKFILGKYKRPEFDYLAANYWSFTEKVDGTNIRLIWNGYGQAPIIAGRTDRAQIPPFLQKKLEELFPVGKLTMLYDSTAMTLYGEGYGARIQKGGGKYIPDGVNFVLFDIRIEDWWLDRESMLDIADNLGVDIIPVVGFGTLLDAANMVRSGLKSRWGDFIAEGIVAKPAVPLQNRAGHRIITKLKYKDFAED